MAKPSSPPARGVQRHRVGGRQPGRFQGVGQIAVDRAVGLDLDQAGLLARRALADPGDPIPRRRGLHQDLDGFILQILFRPGQPGHAAGGRSRPPGKISVRRATAAAGALIGRCIRSRWMARVWRTELRFLGFHLLRLRGRRWRFPRLRCRYRICRQGLHQSNPNPKKGLDSLSKSLTYKQWPNPSFHRTCRGKPRQSGEFKH